MKTTVYSTQETRKVLIELLFYSFTIRFLAAANFEVFKWIVLTYMFDINIIL